MKTENWEEEFKKKCFVDVECWNEAGESWTQPELYEGPVKDFISSLLKQKEREVLEMVGDEIDAMNQTQLEIWRVRSKESAAYIAKRRILDKINNRLKEIE